MIQPECGNERADVGRDPFREIKLSGASGNRGEKRFPVQLRVVRLLLRTKN